MLLNRSMPGPLRCTPAHVELHQHRVRRNGHSLDMGTAVWSWYVLSHPTTHLSRQKQGHQTANQAHKHPTPF